MGTYSGAFMSGHAVAQPMASNPEPAKRHGEKVRPDNDWSAPPSPNGGGYPGAEEVTPAMAARGINRDFGHQWGHGGTEKTRNARRSRFVSKLLGLSTNAQNIIEGADADAAAAAHGDKTAAYIPRHVYDPSPDDFMGESYVVDSAVGGEAVAISGRVIAKTNQGWFVDGPLHTMYQPTGFRRGMSRRYAVAHYSSPTLGAMYSKNTLRGVLPQMIATPYNQPANYGINASGIASNQRAARVNFATPTLFRSPPSESDLMEVAASNIVGNVMGMGM